MWEFFLPGLKSFGQALPAMSVSHTAYWLYVVADNKYCRKVSNRPVSKFLIWTRAHKSNIALVGQNIKCHSLCCHQQKNAVFVILPLDYKTTRTHPKINKSKTEPLHWTTLTTYLRSSSSSSLPLKQSGLWQQKLSFRSLFGKSHKYRTNYTWSQSLERRKILRNCSDLFSWHAK